MRDPNKRPHGQEEIIKVAHQLWEELPWKSFYKWIDRMPERVTNLYRRNGGSYLLVDILKHVNFLCIHSL